MNKQQKRNDGNFELFLNFGNTLHTVCVIIIINFYLIKDGRIVRN